VTIDHIDEQISGSGCIAQVHKAKIRIRSADNTEQQLTVALKVRHPQIPEIIEQDVSIMTNIAWLIDKIPMFHFLDLPATVKQFSDFLESQIDLRTEAKTLEQFRENFKKFPRFQFPEPYWASDALLIESWEQGDSITKYCGTDEGVALSAMGLQAFLKMAIQDNLIHSDLVNLH